MRLLAVRRDDRSSHLMSQCPGGQCPVISVPEVLALALNRRPVLQLGVEESRQNVGQEVAGAEVHPSVLVHLSSKEAGTIGSLLPDDLRPFQIPELVDHPSAAFAAGG